MASPEPIVDSTLLFVRGLRVLAPIGIHPHERGTLQSLILDLEMEVARVAADRIEETFDYERVRDAVQGVIASGHIALVECFAERIAHVLLASGNIERLLIRVTKPTALAPDADGAGCELRLRRG